MTYFDVLGAVLAFLVGPGMVTAYIVLAVIACLLFTVGWNMSDRTDSFIVGWMERSKRYNVFTYDQMRLSWWYRYRYWSIAWFIFSLVFIWGSLIALVWANAQDGILWK